MKKRSIIFVAGLHGNELATVRALKKARIPFILGNPRAAKKNVRFTARDLNASFNVKGKSYEIKRAKEILQAIPRDSLVVDFHTTRAKTAPFAIVTDKSMIPFAATTGLTNVVLMKYNMKRGHALIDHCDGISVEAGSHDTRASHNTTLRVARNVLRRERHPIVVYEVYGKLAKPGKYRNFKKHPLGFVPVLAGETSYNFYGLKARRIAHRS